MPGFSIEENGNEAKENDEAEIEETIEANLSLERDLHSYLAARVEKIEMGLRIVDDGVESQTDAGRIDILAKHNALGQIIGYMGCMSTIRKFKDIPVRGISIASGFEQRVVYAAKALQNLKLVKYQLSFDFQEIT